MKKFNLLILVSVLVYLMIALWGGYQVKQSEADKSQFYKVEVNRIYESLSEGTPPDRLDLDSFEYVKKVIYFTAEDLKDRMRAEEFYAAGNKEYLIIKPFFQEQELIGAARFEILEPVYDTQTLLALTEICLGLMELFTLCILLYLKYKFLKPLERLSNIPEELARGHLKEIIKEEKNQYFSKFLWGIGLLKDNLAVAKKRELQLTREKKRLLLSLSHDIKTPLNTIKLYGKALEKHLYAEEADRDHAAHQIGEKAVEIEGFLAEIIKSSREDIIDLQIDHGEFYLDDLIHKVLDTYQEACRIRMTELRIGEHDNILLKGDVERAVEVVENILENAFKYGDGRRIDITFSQEEYCQLVHIFNTGLVVNDTEFNHIFESFFRGSNLQGKPGHGLGLYICREIMQKMDGEIFARREKEGMTFVLVFRI